MIKITENKEDIIKLWQESFGDSEADILYFIDNAKGAECLMMDSDGEPASMLYLVDCVVNGVKGKYIYAACTAEKYRGKGLMTELLHYSYSLNYPFICLIPANDGLIDYYTKRGLPYRFKIDEIIFHQTEEINEYLFEGYHLTAPVALMHKGE